MGVILHMVQRPHNYTIHWLKTEYFTSLHIMPYDFWIIYRCYYELTNSHKIIIKFIIVFVLMYLDNKRLLLILKVQFLSFEQSTVMFCIIEGFWCSKLLGITEEIYPGDPFSHFDSKRMNTNPRVLPKLIYRLIQSLSKIPAGFCFLQKFKNYLKIHT